MSGAHRRNQREVKSKYEAARDAGTRRDRHAPGCISQGRTGAEALENIREAIAGCLETRAAHGMPLTIEAREVEVPA